MRSQPRQQQDSTLRFTRDRFRQHKAGIQPQSIASGCRRVGATDCINMTTSWQIRRACSSGAPLWRSSRSRIFASEPVTAPGVAAVPAPAARSSLAGE
jgi:hypothetical protein